MIRWTSMFGPFPFDEWNGLQSSASPVTGGSRCLATSPFMVWSRRTEEE